MAVQIRRARTGSFVPGQEVADLWGKRNIRVKNQQFRKMVAAPDGPEIRIGWALPDIEVHAGHAAGHPVPGHVRGHAGRKERHATANVAAWELGHGTPGEDRYAGGTLVKVREAHCPDDHALGR